MAVSIPAQRPPGEHYDEGARNHRAKPLQFAVVILFVFAAALIAQVLENTNDADVAVCHLLGNVLFEAVLAIVVASKLGEIQVPVFSLKLSAAAPRECFVGL